FSIMASLLLNCFSQQHIRSACLIFQALRPTFFHTGNTPASEKDTPRSKKASLKQRYNRLLSSKNGTPGGN
ncbi:MAG: hypothetical protein PHS41_11415, partial [Victivallaceae bacterium]|nr:hypothetical protein [Victivallaceae bacterium]